MTIRLTKPSIDDADIEAVAAVLMTGHLVQGAQVAAFEDAVAAYVGTRYAVAVSSGTAALHLSLLGLGVGPGDVVVTAAYSWPATGNVIELCGARSVFVDVDRETLNIDCDELDRTLLLLAADQASRGRVKAILPVHAFGNPADMSAILEIAQDWELPVIEDAACALGSRIGTRACGAWGHAGCFSFHPRKTITTGEGGMITTDDPQLAATLKSLRNHGLDPIAESPDFRLAGFNYRMTEIQGALGLTQMRKIDRIIAARQQLCVAYDQLLEQAPLTRQLAASGSVPNGQSYVALLSEHDTGRRDALLSGLRNQGVEATIGTWNLPLTTYFSTKYGFRRGDFPATDYVFDAAVTLPMHEFLGDEELAKVAQLVRSLVHAPTQQA